MLNSNFHTAVSKLTSCEIRNLSHTYEQPRLNLTRFFLDKSVQPCTTVPISTHQFPAGNHRPTGLR